MAPRHKQKHVTRNQRRQQRANNNDEDNARKSVNITDIIGDFRAACLNRARDVRNFADSRDSFVLDKAEQDQLRELTGMLTEQLGFLQDAWDTMMRLVEEHQIDLKNDDAYISVELSRAHTLKVAAVAYQISDRFLSGQDGNDCVDDHRNGDEGREDGRATTETITAAKEKDTEDANNPKTDNVANYGEKVREVMENNEAIFNNEAPQQTWQRGTNPLQHAEREQAT